MELFKAVVGPVGSSKPPLLILHGLFGSHRNWRQIAKAISERRGCLVVSADLRNHGKSVTFSHGKPQGHPMTWPLLISDLQRLLKEIGRPANLMGHSLGGHLVMQSLFQPSSEPHPRPNRAIIVDIAPVAYDFAHSPQRDYLRLMRKLNQSCPSRQQAMEEFRKCEPDEAIVQFLFTNHGKFPGSDQEGFLLPLDELERGMLLLMDTFSAPSSESPAAEKVRIPVQFIKGGKSGYMADKDDGVIAERFANPSISIIPEGGHWLHYQFPEEFLAAIQPSI